MGRGARKIRDADAHFPAVGARFHHQVGVAPLVLNDHTEVLKNEPPSRLVLRAKTRPFGTARVDLGLLAEGAGTRADDRSRRGRAQPGPAESTVRSARPRSKRPLASTTEAFGGKPRLKLAPWPIAPTRQRAAAGFDLAALSSSRSRHEVRRCIWSLSARMRCACRVRRRSSQRGRSGPNGVQRSPQRCCSRDWSSRC